MADAPIATGVQERTVSNWAAPAVTGLLADALATYNEPYQAYGGAQVAGAQPLQTQAFTGLQGLATPTAVTGATNYLNAAAGAQAPTYQTGTFGNQYVAPSNVYSGTTVGSMFDAPDAYQSASFNAEFNAPAPYRTSNIASTFKAPGAYQTGEFSSGIAPGSIQGYQGAQFSNQFNYDPATISTGLGRVGSVQSYINPYVQNVVDVQSKEARRQAEISRMADASRLAKAGAYGGSRQAVMEAEGGRNLATQLGDITAKGYQSAYDTALKQRLAESGLSMEAQKATEAGRQFGAEGKAKYGLEGLKAQELSRQFAYDKGVLGAKELEAKYGLEAQRLKEQSKQFGATQAMTAADLQTRYGLDAAKANELSKQFGAGQAMTAAELKTRYGLDAQKATELSRQFGAQQALTSATTAGAQGLEAARLTEQSKQEAARQAQTGSEAAARYGLEGLRAQEQSRQFGAGLAKDYSAQQLAAARDLGNLGIAQGDQQLRQLQAQMAGGETQRAIEQAGLTADYKDFLEQRGWEASQQAGLAGLLKQFPMETVNTFGQPPDLLTSILGGGITGFAAMQKLFGSSMSAQGLADLWKSITGTDAPTGTAAPTGTTN